MKNTFSFPISYGLSKTGLPLIPLQVGEHTMLFLIDTGATHSIIDESILRELDSSFVHKIPNKTIKISGIEGTEKQGIIYELSFKIDDQTYIQEFVTNSLIEASSEMMKNSGIQIHGILGTDFLFKNKWIIDFENLEIKQNN